VIRARKVAAVSRFEFLNVARRKSYLLVTFGLPIFFSALSGGMLALQGYFLQSRIDQAVVYGLVDHYGATEDARLWGTLEDVDDEDAREAVIQGNLAEVGQGFMLLDEVVFLRFDDEASARALVASDRLTAVYVVEEDYLETGNVSLYESEHAPVLSVRSATIEPVLGRLLSERLLDGNVEVALMERALEPLVIKRTVTFEDGATRSSEDRVMEIVLRTGVPFLLGVLLLTALLSASGYLVQTIALDKESKVVEVLLSSADPDEILTGKLLGLGAAGLLQFFVWASMVVGGALTAAAVVASLDVPIPWEALATGSLGSSVAETQKLTLGWAMLAVLPLMMLVVLLEEPHGAVGQVLTWIPFSAPLTVIVRMSLDPGGIAWWEVVGALLVLVASTWLSIRFGARLFRVGLLVSGSRPSLREILRQARLLD
jgi:ABC-2 type transport system permease protein